MLFFHRLAYLLALLLATTSLAVVADAAPTKEQRAAEVQLRILVKKAGNLYSSGDYEESGKVIAEVQARYAKLVAEGDKEIVALLAGVYRSLTRAHALLELEGVDLPALKAPGAAKPTDPPTPAGKASFVKHVVPVLLKKCGRCHVSNVRGMFSMANFDLASEPPPFAATCTSTVLPGTIL